MNTAIAAGLFALVLGGLAWLIAKIQAGRALQLLKDEFIAKLNSASQEIAQLQERCMRIPEIQSRLVEAERSRDDLAQQAAHFREVSAATNAQLEKELETLVLLRNESVEATQRREGLERDVLGASIKLADVSAQLDAERAQSVDKLALLKEQFQNLANEILEEKSKRFTEQNQSNLGQLLGPLKEQLTGFQAKVEDVYVKETKDRTALSEQVRHLADLNQALSLDAKNLTTALKGSNKLQGNWGELILQRVLESSGLRLGEEYDIQESHTRDDGSRSQPDVTIHLPGDRHLVVDAKVSLNAFVECTTAEDEAGRQSAVRRHVESVRSHIKGLSGKNYQLLYGLKSLDSVLMFVPIEPAFTLAIAHDRELFMDAWQKNIILASPSTLMYLVGTVAHLWRQDAQNKNATDIAKRGAELYDKLAAFVTDLEMVGKRIKQAQDSFEDARSKLARGRGNVIRQAEMLKELGVRPTKILSSEIINLDELEKVQTLSHERDDVPLSE